MRDLGDHRTNMSDRPAADPTMDGKRLRYQRIRLSMSDRHMIRMNLQKKMGWRATVKRYLITAALLAHGSSALAGSLVTVSNCNFSRHYGYNSCQTTKTYIPDPIFDVEQERRDASERQEGEAKWLAFCKPTFRTDAYGVRRASYAKSGCEFGRSE